MATTMTPQQATTAGEPFAIMLRGAVAPSVAAGLVAVGVFWGVRGTEAGFSALLGVLLATSFFASGLAVMARVIRDANPVLFMAVAMSVYLGQMIALFVVFLVTQGLDWVDGPAVGWTILVTAVVWQVFAMRSWRRARTPVFDPGTDRRPGAGTEGER
jgi:ATP synthase protein I